MSQSYYALTDPKLGERKGYDAKIGIISVLMQVLTFALLLTFGGVAIKKVAMRVLDKMVHGRNSSEETSAADLEMTVDTGVLLFDVSFISVLRGDGRAAQEAFARQAGLAARKRET